MRWFSRRRDRQPGPEQPPADEQPTGTEQEQQAGREQGPGPGQQVRALCDGLALPCIRLGLGDTADDPGAGYLGGHPYLPEGMGWPVIDGRPAAFVGQVNFAALPTLPDFPTSGLLQWFTGTDDLAGLTFDDSAGAVGFVVRWFPDLTAPSRATPTDPAPFEEDEDHRLPIRVDPATLLVPQPGRSLPSWGELPGDVRELPVWAAYATSLGESAEDTEFVYDEYVRAPLARLDDDEPESLIGGYASFVQADPRGTGGYPPSGTPAGRLLVELNGSEVDGWGDLGIGHLFGDPAALAAGDTSTIRYHWDC